MLDIIIKENEEAMKRNQEVMERILKRLEENENKKEDQADLLSPFVLR